ncbi:surface carbohydrate biosynthesis protein [Sphingomonas sp.]|jgi:surface carbohydrate biosynthesis protein|uniref:surface carbohydrate biosynthesis protein n=1 Tax=Sphingomonas sp. TaxID=28214 RepID=UPI002DF627A0|nr:surface carbohydrate biosynthesis protein [Sphingomonas sp.]HEV2568129.1 surface carbohydrate biosynthesis protein [Sphingomonas sp.]
MARICLIVDNPLRDLEGNVLLGRALANRGHQAFLIPMYSQAFAVSDVQPQMVIANYVRPNNVNLLKSYRRKGIKVAVMDTEGAGGRSPVEFASLVAHGGAIGNVDLYCAWGPAQFEALQPILGDAVKLTGCPRYDLCAPDRRPALRRPAVESGFVLINTNFPGVNPRFSSGTANERRVALKVGFDTKFADDYLSAAKRTLDGMLALMAELAKRLPQTSFVLRPHPFENASYYSRLTKLPNFSVHQEGTSLEWLAQSSMLIHLNCSTAVEARMLDKPAVTPAWLDDPVLRIPGPSAVSQHVQSMEELVGLVELVTTGTCLPAPAEVTKASRDVIHSFYLAIDGEAAERVSDEVDACLAAPLVSDLGRPKLKVITTSLVQRLLGQGGWFVLVDMISRGQLRRKRQSKNFSMGEVREILDRVNKAFPGTPAVCSEAGGWIMISAARQDEKVVQAQAAI